MRSADEEVKSYLKELDRYLAPLPRRRRKEVVDEISAHIAESRGEVGSDHPIEDVLDRVGDPRAIALEATQGEPAATSRSRGLEIAAIIFLLPGSLLLPIIGWLVGLILLWASSIWTTKDKVIGTLVVPGGLLPAAFLGLSPVMTCSQMFIDGRMVQNTCSGGWVADLWLVIWIVSILGPIATGIYLGLRLRRARVLAPQMT